MKSEFEIAITQLSSDRNLSPEVILEAIEAALVSAYKRNYGSNQNITVTINPQTGQARVFVKQEVVEEVVDDRSEISVADAQKHQKGAKLGDLVDIELTPRNFGRIAAQTAKQVIMQRIREAERDSVYLEYADRAGEIVNGVVRNIESRTGNVTISLGKAEASLLRSEQIPGEQYRFNQRLRVYVVEVERTGHGPQIVVSRTHRGLLRRLLELEVPEIYNGTVEIKSIAREAGSRSKVAVAALQAGVDPVGSCVGMRGVRVQNIVNELSGEKIDVVAWSPDMEMFIANALSPAKVVSVFLNEEEKTANVVVPDKSLSLAIGKEGQNARLAAKLTGWRIDIHSETEAAEQEERMAAEAAEAAVRAEELKEARQQAAELLAEAQVGLDEDEEDLAVEASTEEAEIAQVADESSAMAISQETEAAEPVSEAGPELAIEAETEDTELEAMALFEPEYDSAETEEAVEQEMASEEETVIAEGPYDWEEESSGEPEGEELLDEDDEGGKRTKGKGKSRQRALEYDEELGRVVARKKRKPNRRRDDWMYEEG